MTTVAAEWSDSASVAPRLTGHHLGRGRQKCYQTLYCSGCTVSTTGKTLTQQALTSHGSTASKTKVPTDSGPGDGKGPSLIASLQGQRDYLS